MTNKSLSEKICEACGIEPKYVVKYTYFGQQENIYETLEEAKQEKEMLKGEIEEAYPDFESNNNNFVKLLEIYFDCKNIKKIILNSILDDFMQDKTNNDLSIDYYYSDLTENCEKFKQAIKNEQWEI